MNDPVVSIYYRPHKECIGTGFLFTSCLVMTNHHVIKRKCHECGRGYAFNKLQVLIHYPHKQVYLECKLVYSIKELDVAILQLAEPIEGACLEMRIDNDFLPEETFRTYSPHMPKSPQTLTLLVNQGMYDDDLYNKSLLFRSNSEVKRGQSGSPIIDSQGKVAAVLHSSGEDSKGKPTNSFATSVVKVMLEIRKRIIKEIK